MEDEVKLFTRSGREQAANARVEGKPRYRVQHSCSRCGGAGGSPAWAHTGYTCYDCGGTGRGRVEYKPLYTAERLAQLDATKAKADARRLAKLEIENARVAAERDARRQQWLADNAGTMSMLAELSPGSAFWTEFAADISRRANPLTERQQAVVDEAYAKLVAERARKVAAHHVGNVGDRCRGQRGAITMCKHIATISRFPSIERYLVKIRLDDGAELTWFTGSSYGEGRGVFDFTVKEHDSYKGVPQTIVQRVKINDEETIK